MNTGEEFENYIQGLFQFLLNMKDEGITVARRVTMIGKSQTSNEIDVFYEFYRAGIHHRVAIECKDWSSPVSIKEVRDFYQKLEEIGNIIGVIISKSGYQDGARKFAKHHRIEILKFDELPSLGNVLAQRIESVALPDESYIGEPFWTIMELREGRLTGSYYCVPQPMTGRRSIPIFFSKAHAKKFMAGYRLDDTDWTIRGLPKHAFRAFILMMRLVETTQNAGPAIFFVNPSDMDKNGMKCLKITSQQLADHYYDGQIQWPDEPNSVQ